MISLIICTYNRDRYIFNTLEHIAACKYPAEKYEILVIDNNSTDNTAPECRRFVGEHPDISVRIIPETSQGLSFARNRGISEARGDVLVFLDDDAYVRKDYLDNLEKYLTDYPEMMAFGGRIDPLFEDGDAPGWLCRWNMSWLSAIDMGSEVKFFKDGRYPIGANMGFRKACLDKAGLFNTALGRSKKNLIGGEEKDIFLKITSLGYLLYYLPQIQVGHVIPASRTSREYIAKLGQGVGTSERIRTSENKVDYLKRLLSEAVKWGATLVLWLHYALKGQIEKGSSLVLFRRSVTEGLLSRGR